MTHAHARSVDTGTDTVLAEIVDGVGVLTFNRPHRRNALHPEMYEAVPRLLEQFADSDDVGCVLVTGAGNAFCAGGDVRDGGSAKECPPATRKTRSVARSALLADNARMVTLLHSMPKVTIAALPGAAVGAGMSIALATDLRIAARSARLIPGWAKLAFSGDFGGAWLLTHLVGPSRALELLVADAPIDAEPPGSGSVCSTGWSTTPTCPPRRCAGPPRSPPGPPPRSPVPKPTSLTRSGCRWPRRFCPKASGWCAAPLTQEHRDAVRAWLASASNKVGARS